MKSGWARAVKLAKKQQNSMQRMTNLDRATSIESPSRAIAHFRAALERNPTAQSIAGDIDSRSSHI